MRAAIRNLQAAIRTWLWPPLVYLLLAVLMTWPLSARIARTLPGLGDAQLQAWTIAWNAHALRTSPATIWHAPIFAPYPNTLAYTDNHLLLSALAAPLVWFSDNPILAHNLLLLASFALSGWAVYALALEWSKQAWPAFIGGAAFAFCAYRLAHLTQLNLLQTAWLPFALLFLSRLLRPPEQGGGRLRDSLLCGVFAGIQCITALYYAFFAAASLGAYALLWIVEQAWRRMRAGVAFPWRTTGLIVLAGGLAALLALPFTLPYARVYASLGIVRSVRELDNWSAPLRAYWSVEARNRLYGRLGEAVVDSGEMVLFPGLAVTLLGLAGLLLTVRSRNGLFWGLLAGCAFVLSLGTGLRLERYGEPLPAPLPYLLLYNNLPGFGALRVPARWGMLVSLGLAVLSTIAIARLLARLRGRSLHLAGGAILALVLAEQAVRPAALPDATSLNNEPAIYRWLAAPQQQDIRRLLELPVARVPRGEELERITWRQWYGRRHWKELPVAYSGLMPFGTGDLLARVQNLPDPAILHYLQIAGIDTLIVHRAEYPPDRLAQLENGLAQSPLVRRRALIEDSAVYSLAPDPQLAAFTLNGSSGASICISDDERMPGLLVLALLRHWEEHGFALYGPGRLRYYEPLKRLPRGRLCDYALLSDAEDPLEHGLTAGTPFWHGAGLALFRRETRLLAGLSLGTPPPGAFHARYPAQLGIEFAETGIRLDGSDLAPPPADETLVVEVDTALLHPTMLQLGAEQLSLAPGLQTLAFPLARGAELELALPPDNGAFLRLRLLAASIAAPAGRPLPATMVATAQAALAGSTLTVDVRAAGAAALLLDIRGAAAYDDRPIHLLWGSRPLNQPGEPLSFQADLLRPAAPWLQGSEPPQDGRYLVYLKDAAHPESSGRPVARFNIRDGALLDFAPVPLPLTIIQ